MKDTNDKQSISEEMAEVRNQLKQALKDVMSNIGEKLSEQEQANIKKEFAELDKLLESIGTGLVHLVVFGKTSVGKSAVINAILGADVAKVGPQHDLTSTVTPYERKPWMLIDVPGVMGKSEFEQMAIKAAKEAHGHVLVVDGEPLAGELEQFNKVHNAVPHTPKIVFVNKWDKMEDEPEEEREPVKERIKAKVRKYVKSDEDIVYGSAQLFDRKLKQKVRQSVPQLIDRLYAEAGTLGQIVSVLDPAKRASDLVGKMDKKILEVRLRVARKAIHIAGLTSAASGVVPFDALLISPGILAGLVYVIAGIMGKKAKLSEEGAKAVAKELLKVCATILVVEFTVVIGLSVALDTLNFLTLGSLSGVLIAADVILLGLFKYRRTVIFGEVVIEYVCRDFSWGNEGPKKIIEECKQRAADYEKSFSIKEVLKRVIGDKNKK